MASKEELQSILNSVGDGILVLSPAGIIELYNDAAISTLGQAVYDFYFKTGKLNINGKKLPELLVLRDPQGKTVDPLKAVIKTGVPATRDDLYFQSAEGGSKTMLYTNVAPIFDEHEKVKKIVMLFRDITAERELQDRMEEFISVTSHELRTPVAVIEGNLSTALLPTIGKMDDKIKKFVKNAYDNTLFLSKLIENLTTLRKIETRGIAAEELESFSVPDLLSQLADEFADTAENKGIKLSIAAARARLPELKSSRAEVKQILVNLIGNAIKYTAVGAVTLQAEFDEALKKFHIRVKDSGIGIKKEHQRKIFTRFYRAEEWQTRKTGGTGLGLYISRRVAEHLGGELEFESDYGKGSTFTLVMPQESPVIKGA